MVEYKLFIENKYDKIYGFYETYGIIALKNKVNIRIIDDISLDKDKVEALVNKFNKEHLEIEHLSQMIEEFLYNFTV